MQQAKYEYKLAIRTKEKQSKEHFSDELNDALIFYLFISFYFILLKCKGPYGH